jgi:hypothetical protein
MKLITPEFKLNPVTYLSISLWCMSAAFLVKIPSLHNFKVQIVTVFLILASGLGLLFAKGKNRYSTLLLIVVILIFTVYEVSAVSLVIRLLENSIKFSVPVLFCYAAMSADNRNRILKIAIALTFVSHGLLALNVIPTPDSFYFMTQKILHFSKPQASVFLYMVGMLDIVASILIFSADNKIANTAIWYCVIWGGITAMARTLWWSDGAFDDVFMKGFAETIVRVPNSLIPLFLLHIRKKGE